MTEAYCEGCERIQSILGGWNLEGLTSIFCSLTKNSVKIENLQIRVGGGDGELPTIESLTGETLRYAL